MSEVPLSLRSGPYSLSQISVMSSVEAYSPLPIAVLIVPNAGLIRVDLGSKEKESKILRTENANMEKQAIVVVRPRACGVGDGLEGALTVSWSFDYSILRGGELRLGAAADDLTTTCGV
ncbi:hypothetical protein F2Q70_00018556 [Brassica cretica]|uniref:Uncharacterized protein n=2 Tax=Brassica cretica TaxID=69181 RepID=A0A8S9HYL0_BRACR|nr:hypothetical protein F2Q70_00018556 [Brassica cretica]